MQQQEKEVNPFDLTPEYFEILENEFPFVSFKGLLRKFEEVDKESEKQDD